MLSANAIFFGSKFYSNDDISILMNIFILNHINCFVKNPNHDTFKYFTSTSQIINALVLREVFDLLSVSFAITPMSGIGDDVKAMYK